MSLFTLLFIFLLNIIYIILFLFIIYFKLKESRDNINNPGENKQIKIKSPSFTTSLRIS